MICSIILRVLFSPHPADCHFLHTGETWTTWVCNLWLQLCFLVNTVNILWFLNIFFSFKSTLHNIHTVYWFIGKANNKLLVVFWESKVMHILICKVHWSPNPPVQSTFIRTKMNVLLEFFCVSVASLVKMWHNTSLQSSLYFGLLLLFFLYTKLKATEKGLK